MSLPGQRRRHRLGCVGRIVAFLLLGAVCILLIDAVFAPWAFFLGGRFRPLAFWQGWGRLHSSTRGDYAVFVRMWPTPGGHSGYASVTGSAELCTPRGERYSLRLGGGFLNKHVWLHSDRQPMHLYLYHRPWFYGFVSTQRRPRLDLYGAWHDPDLVMDDHGTLSTAFLPDGRLDQGPARQQPAAREIATVSLRSGGQSDFDAACLALAH
jgi:hypothetical protein